VGEPEYGADARFRTNKDRRQAREEIVARIQSVLRLRKREDWLSLFVQHRIPAGPINRLDEVAADRELQARGMLYSVTAFGTKIPQVGLGIGIDGSSDSFRFAPPGLGEHTDAVLREQLGLDEEQIANLRNQNII
jgi:crotonobetainyl-CoA:carnitine CoA-transferase CaiB-like acyl-CoA transferase